MKNRACPCLTGPLRAQQMGRSHERLERAVPWGRPPWAGVGVTRQGWLCLDDPGSRPVTHCSADPYIACDDDRPLK